MVAVGAGTDAQVVPTLPVVDVVPRLETGSGVVGDLVPLQAGLGQRMLDTFGHLDLHLFVQGFQQALAVAGVEGVPSSMVRL